MKCEKCGSENVMEGLLSGYAGVTFLEKGTEHKFRPNAYRVTCKACKDCGAIFDFRILQKNGK